jgi:hypothetical protein
MICTSQQHTSIIRLQQCAGFLDRQIHVIYMRQWDPNVGFALVLNRYRKCPRQQNGFDCGVFALQCAEYEGRGAPYKFSQDDMPYYRMRIVADLLQNKIADVPP